MRKITLIRLFWILVVGVGIYIYKNIDFKDIVPSHNIVLPTKEVTVNKINIEETLIGTWYQCGGWNRWENNKKIIFFNDKTGFLNVTLIKYEDYPHHELMKSVNNVEEKFEWKYQDSILYIFPESPMYTVGELTLSYNDDNSFYLTDEIYKLRLIDGDKSNRSNDVYEPFLKQKFSKNCP